MSGDRVLVVAAEDVPAGAEVTDSYGVSALAAPRGDRRGELLRTFHFACRCRACDADFPTADSWPSDLPGGAAGDPEGAAAGIRAAMGGGGARAELESVYRNRNQSVRI